MPSWPSSTEGRRAQVGPEEVLGSGRDREPRWGRLVRPVVLVVTLGAAGMGLNACGSGTAFPEPARSTSVPSVASTTSTMGVTTTTESRDQVVLEAWKRDLLNYEVAATTNPPAYESPLLIKSFVNPDLDFIRRTLLSFRLRGWVARKPYRVWPVRVVNLHRSNAVVIGCGWDPGVEVSPTEKQVPGSYGQVGFTQFRSTLVRGPGKTGNWRIKSSTALPTTNKAGPCRGFHAPQ
jgi:hypothetical protein